MNWEIFVNLPGAVEHNFEKLCRMLIRCHYAQYGELVSRANQPGVEFHLLLTRQCSLGDSGRWYGWQCRWYDIPSGRAIGATRKKKIEDAISTTERELPNLTDWVLWTRHSLTKGDQEWFYGLKTKMQLRLWTSSEVEEHLTGAAILLRDTYFGELMLTPDSLREIHSRSIAPIRQRWLPEVHQIVDAERKLRELLCEPPKWEMLQAVPESLSKYIATTEGAIIQLPVSMTKEMAKLVKDVREFSAILKCTYSLLEQGDFDLLQQHLSTQSKVYAEDYSQLVRKLRSGRHNLALIITNILSDIRIGKKILEELSCCLEERLVCVLASAGCGKTQLSAQLTAEIEGRSAGILLFGRDLSAGNNLDNLASCISINGIPPSSMEALIAAINAAGQRAGTRLPIVIDGLNEAEDPRNWKALLSSFKATLNKYPYVLAVCTLRTSFADEILPEDISQIKILDFGLDTKEAIRRYFSFYRIKHEDIIELPTQLLSHPLTLRLFCEVTNQKRERDVGIEAIPGSLTSLFARYLNQSAQRIAELAPRMWKYYVQDVQNALYRIGLFLWDGKSRSISISTLRQLLGDSERPWDGSIVRALEQDGVLLRVPGATDETTSFMVVYDALAGHLIADAILKKFGSDGFIQRLQDSQDSSTKNNLINEEHPLAEDILCSLVGLFPRRLNQPFWPLLKDPLRTKALAKCVLLEGYYLDALTIDKLKTVVFNPPNGSSDLLDRLWQTRGAQGHPLNADFLDSVLRPLHVAERDLRWTEWLRSNEKVIYADLVRLENIWRTTDNRFLEDYLRAKWVMWTLSSTVKDLRDQATRTLYWFGRGNGECLFELTIDGLSINDPYISERLLASSYGVVMAHQCYDPKFETALTSFLVELRRALTGINPEFATFHWLMRLYVQGIVSFAKTFYPQSIPTDIEIDGYVQFAPGTFIEPIKKDDPRLFEVSKTLQIDFKNYTLGRLFTDRRNYDMNHAGHQQAVAFVLGTVWAMGWRKDGIGLIDSKISGYSYRGNNHYAERYGKKYSWIGYNFYAGILCDSGQFPKTYERLPDLHVDPSFPVPPPSDTIILPNWTEPNIADDQSWIYESKSRIPQDLIFRDEIAGHSGPWIAVSGVVEKTDRTLDRSVFVIITTLLVDEKNKDRLEDTLLKKEYPGNYWLPHIPEDYYTFAGEIPWSPQFASCNNNDHLYNEEVVINNEPPIEVEILAHCYSWESYHSNLNRAGNILVPSKLFSQRFGLRSVPQSPNQTSEDRSLAAISLAAPKGFSGNTLYLRQDLVGQYADGRRLIIFCWGERNLSYEKRIAWKDDAQLSNAGLFREIFIGK